MKKILLTGVNGQVGHALHALLEKTTLDQPFELIGLTRHQLDLSRDDEIRRVIQEIKPSLIINPAAYTAVDRAESEPELAFAINAQAPKVMAEAAAQLNASLIHFSTDYVYDGQKSSAYLETDTVNPLSVYGKTKLAGEQAIAHIGLPHLIFRTSWVYGAYGKNFLKTILRLSAEHEKLRIVSDQYGSPTSSQSIAAATAQLLLGWNRDEVAQTGVYHMTNSGSTSWHRFACQIIREYEDQIEHHHLPVLKARVDYVEAISTNDYPTPAVRPANSRLDNTKLKTVFNVELPLWQEALQDELNTLMDATLAEKQK